MKPLKVTFALVGEMVTPAHPIHLDALLAWARVKEAERALADGESLPDYSCQHDLPLARHGDDEDWCWKASALSFNTTLRRQIHMTRKTDARKIADDRERFLRYGAAGVNLGSGALKQYSFRVPVEGVTEAVAYCVGDPARVEQLLQAVRHIGKMRRLGFGRVLQLQVQTLNDDPGFWRYRLAPSPLVDGALPMRGNIRPPYWDRTAERACYLPVSWPF